jgi:osmotically-inducible protein OsmY
VRPDSRVYEDVCDRLTGHGQIDASAIEVSVADGIVKLSGTVDSRADKRLAESLADSVSGVRDVDNSLTLRGASANIS